MTDRSIITTMIHFDLPKTKHLFQGPVLNIIMASSTSVCPFARLSREKRRQ